MGRSAWLLIPAWALVLSGLGLWLAGTPEAPLRGELMRWQFWVLELQFFLLLALSIASLPAFLRSLDINLRAALFPIATSALMLALTLWVAPNTSRIYFDEQIYQNVGQNLTDLRLAQMCNDGNVEYGALQCWRGEYNKEPYGYPYLLSLAYRLTGVREGSAFVLNAVIGALSVFTVFLVTVALTGEPNAGNLASLVAALTPEAVRWSHTAAAEPSAAFACIVALMAALAFVRLRTSGSLLWMTSASVFAMQFRPECLLIAPVVLVVVLLEARTEFIRPRLWWAALVGLLLGAAHVAHLLVVRNEAWGSAGPRFSLQYLAGNLQANGWFYLGDRRFPVVFSLLAVSALATWGKPRRMVIPLLHFLLFWGVFLFFYAGSYNYGADDRFSVMAYLPVAVLAGVGAWRLAQHAGSLVHRPVAARNAVIAAIGIQFLWYAPYVRAVGEEAWGARADVAFAREAVAALPKNTIVLTHNPSMFQVWGQSAAQASLAATDDGFAAKVLAPRYAGGVYFHWNFWCNVADPVQQSFCTAILEKYPHELVREYRERDYWFALYRLLPTRAATPPS